MTANADYSVSGAGNEIPQLGSATRPKRRREKISRRGAAPKRRRKKTKTDSPPAPTEEQSEATGKRPSEGEPDHPGVIDYFA